MKRGFLSFCVLVVIVGFWALDVQAEEGSMATLTGEVSVMIDEEGAVSDVFLSTDSDVYDVVLDANGMKLAAEMEGKTVQVKGAVNEQEEQLLLTVISYEEASNAAETEPEGE